MDPTHRYRVYTSGFRMYFIIFLSPTIPNPSFLIFMIQITQS